MLNIKEIKKLGIFELRAVAREVGVASPTTKKRDQLIEQIESIQKGEIIPCENKKLGRPIKFLKTKEEILSSIIKADDEELQSKIEKNKVSSTDLAFEQVLDFDSTPMSYITSTFCGVVRKTNKDNYYVLGLDKISQKNIILIEDMYIKQYQIKEGDFVEGTTLKRQDSNYSKLETLIKLNGKSASENSWNENGEYIISQKDFYQNIKFGNFKFSGISNFDECFKQMQDIVKNSKGIQTKFVVLGVELDVDKYLSLKSLDNTLCLVSLFEDGDSFAYDKICDCINYTNTQFLRGENVVVFVLETFLIYETLVNFCNKESEKGLNANDIFKKLIGTSKATEHSSITTFAFYYEDVKYQDMIKKFKRKSK